MPQFTSAPFNDAKPSKTRILIFSAATVVVLAGAAAVYHVFFRGGSAPEIATNQNPPPGAAPTDQGPPSPPADTSPPPTIASNDPPSESQPPADTSPPPVSPEVAQTPPARPRVPNPDTPASEEDEILAPPRKALLEFLNAKSWKERQDLVQLPETTAAEMEEYYASNPDGPVKFTSITFQNSEPVPNKNSMFFLFHVTTENVPEGFPVSVEETPDGYKIDWHAFVEFNDLHLYKFMTQKPEGSHEFHVIMRRAHYFGSGIPDLENKYAFRIEPPIPGNYGYAFVDKNSSLVESKLSYQLQWPAISYPIVQLKWVHSEEGESYIALEDLVQNNWRADDADDDPSHTASSDE